MERAQEMKIEKLKRLGIYDTKAKHSRDLPTFKNEYEPMYERVSIQERMEEQMKYD